MVTYDIYLYPAATTQCLNFPTTNRYDPSNYYGSIPVSATHLVTQAIAGSGASAANQVPNYDLNMPMNANDCLVLLNKSNNFTGIDFESQLHAVFQEDRDMFPIDTPTTVAVQPARLFQRDAPYAEMPHTRPSAALSWPVSGTRGAFVQRVLQPHNRSSALCAPETRPQALARHSHPLLLSKGSGLPVVEDC